MTKMEMAPYPWYSLRKTGFFVALYRKFLRRPLKYGHVEWRGLHDYGLWLASLDSVFTVRVTVRDCWMLSFTEQGAA